MMYKLLVAKGERVRNGVRRRALQDLQLLTQHIVDQFRLLVVLVQPPSFVQINTDTNASDTLNFVVPRFQRWR